MSGDRGYHEWFSSDITNCQGKLHKSGIGLIDPLSPSQSNFFNQRFEGKILNSWDNWDSNYGTRIWTLATLCRSAEYLFFVARLVIRWALNGWTACHQFSMWFLYSRSFILVLRIQHNQWVSHVHQKVKRRKCGQDSRKVGSFHYITLNNTVRRTAHFRLFEQVSHQQPLFSGVYSSYCSCSSILDKGTQIRNWIMGHIHVLEQVPVCCQAWKILRKKQGKTLHVNVDVVQVKLM